MYEERAMEEWSVRTDGGVDGDEDEDEGKCLGLFTCEFRVLTRYTLVNMACARGNSTLSFGTFNA